MRATTSELMQAVAITAEPTQKEQAQGGFALPRRPNYPAPRWFSKDEVIRVGDLTLDGMVYFGAPPAGGAGAESSLIDPTLLVAAAGDFFRVGVALRATYKALTPTERRGYLSWLAQGRDHPDVDMRLVFLYFYGLERRLTVDVHEGRCPPAEVSALLAEVARLRDAYGAREPALANAVERLVYWVRNTGAPPALYAQKDPQFRRVFGLRTYTQVAVGQAAAAGAPLSAGLARTWAMECWGSYMRADVRLHRDEFFGLFEDLYSGVHGAGIVLPSAGRPMKLHYSPSSLGLVEHPALTRVLPGVLDAGDFTGHSGRIKAIFDAASAEVEKYAKLAVRSPHLLGTLDCLQQLPTRLWPQKTKDAMRALIQRAAEGLRPLKAAALVEMIDPTARFTKATAAGAGALLAGVGLGTYPPLLSGGARAIKSDASVVLLPGKVVQTDGADGADGAALERARIVLDAAVCALAAEAAVKPHQVQWLEASLGDWHEEPLRASILLRASLQIALAHPKTTAAIKRDAQSLDDEQRRVVGEFALRAVACTGVPSPAQVKLLGKLLSALGLDGKTVPAQLHALASGTPRRSGGSLELDAARIAALQSDTARVAAMLSSIFVDDEHDEAQGRGPATPTPASEADSTGQPQVALLGLDASHSALAAQLLTRSQWSQCELAAAAAALDLMPAGALERINEACFDIHDLPFTEGEDPVEINPEILEKVR